MARCAPRPYLWLFALPSRFRKRPRTDSTTTRPNPRSDRSSSSAVGGCASLEAVVGVVTPIKYRRRQEREPLEKANPSAAARCGPRGSIHWRDLDQSVRHHVRAWSDRLPFFRFVSVRTGALEFCKATVASSDLATGGPPSNRWPTCASTPSRRRLSDKRYRPCPLAGDYSVSAVRFPQSRNFPE